jgi:hypothetical protein
MKFKFLLILIALLSGCASITSSKLQPVSVQTVYENEEIAGVGCSLTNDAGKWFVTTPGSVTVQKSTGDMLVDCKKDRVIVGTETLVSKAQGMLWANIIAGGGIGYVVDRNTGAGFDYPNSVTVMLRKISGSTGTVTPAVAPK